MGESAMNRNQNNLAGQQNADGYKPSTVPNAFKVIQGNAEKNIEEAAMMNEQRNDAYQIPKVVYDGGTILVPREHHASTIEWFETYAGWKRSGKEFKSDAYINTELQWGVWIYSDDRITLPDPLDSNIRWCFKVRDLEKLLNTLTENREKVTAIYRGPLGHDYFDVWVTEGIRLTVQGAPDMEKEEWGHDWIRVGVKNIGKAKEWYNRFIGMSVISEHQEEGYIVMGMRANFHGDQEHPFWVLEQLPERKDAAAGNKDERARPYTFVDKSAFLEYREFLSEQNMFVSEVEGSLKGLAKFHIFDPDGNRFNIRTF